MVALHLQKAWKVDLLKSWAEWGSRIIAGGLENQEMVTVVPSVDGSLGSQSQICSRCSSSLVSREASMVCLRVRKTVKTL